MLRTTFLLLSVVTLCVASQAQAQITLQFPTQASEFLNTEALRDHLMRQAGGIPGLQHSVGTQAPVEPSFLCNALGFATIPLPSYLRSNSLQLSSDCGLLITFVDRESAAEKAGLRAGMTIVEIDDQPVLATADLKQLTGRRTLLVLADDGYRKIGLVPEQLTHPPAQTLSSFSLSEANGVMAIAAIVNTENGPERVELKGNRQQVDAQLSQLTPAVQDILRLHLR